MPDLFDLSAKISVDDKGVDSALSSTQKKVQSLEGEFKKLDKTAQNAFRAGTASKIAALRDSLGIDKLKSGLSDLSARAAHLRTNTTESKALAAATRQTAAAINQDLKGALTTLSPSLAGVAGAAGPLTAVAAGLLAVVGAGAGIYRLATYSAELGGEIYDLSQKVNFGAETLSGLKVAAELSGGSLASLATSLGLFDKNIEEANQKGSEMSRVFKVLKIDTDNNEVALRQAFVALAKMPSGYQQTAVAMKLFGRSGKEILGVIKETDGNIDAFIEKMRAMGLVITDSGAKKADEFGDQLTIVRNKLEAVARQIGQELIPTVSQAADDISAWLSRNQSELRSTASELGSVVSWVYKLGKAVADNSLLVMTVKVVTQLETWAEGSRQGIAEAARKRGSPIQLGPLGMQQLHDDSAEYAGPSSNYGVAKGPWAKTPKLDFGGGGGGGRGGGAAKLSAGQQLLNQLTDEYNRLQEKSNNLTKVEIVAKELLGSKYKNLSASMRQQIEEMATYITIDAQAEENSKNLADGAMLIADALTEQYDAIREASGGADQYDKVIVSLERALKKKNLTLRDSTRALMEENAQQLRNIAFWARAKPDIEATTDALEANNRAIHDQVEALRPAVELYERLTAAKINMVDDSLLGPAPPPFKVGIDETTRQKVEDLAGFLTDTLANALHDGFDRGIKAGLVTFAEGILQMIESAALRALEKKLTDVFLNAIGGGSSGSATGNASGILSSFLGLFTPHKSGLGYVPFDNYPALLHRGERVLTASENQSGQPGGAVVNVTFMLPPNMNSQTFQGRETQYQISRKLSGAFAKAGLTG